MYITCYITPSFIAHLLPPPRSDTGPTVALARIEISPTLLQVPLQAKFKVSVACCLLALIRELKEPAAVASARTRIGDSPMMS